MKASLTKEERLAKALNAIARKPGNKKTPSAKAATPPRRFSWEIDEI
jgi:hypothetical protein